MHSSVIIFGEDIVEQMAPFHEFEVDGEESVYVKEIDITEDARMEYAKSRQFMGLSPEFTADDFIAHIESYYGFEKVSNRNKADIKNANQFGWIEVENKKNIRVIQRTNPNAHWDYWVVGGRWRKFFKLKNGSRSGSAYKRDINFDGMLSDIESIANTAWLKYEQFKSENPHVQLKTMDDFIDDDGELKKGQVKEWREQPGLDKLFACLADQDSWFETDALLIGKDFFFQYMRGTVFTTAAMVYQGEWIDFDDSKWFSIKARASAQKEWNERLMSIIDGLDDDTVISVLDSHK